MDDSERENTTSTDYGELPLDREDAGEDPLDLFRRWFEDAKDAQVPEPTAMSLATVGVNVRPSLRYVLLKGFDERGLVFFTNYESRKARELKANPWAALCIHWQLLHRQVRIEGRVSRLLPDESDAYFASRDRGSQIGAWASPQSAPLARRIDLERRVAAAERRFAETEKIPRPPYWGGFRLTPVAWEFWQGRRHRLHDRFRFVKEANGWRKERMAP